MINLTMISFHFQKIKHASVAKNKRFNFKNINKNNKFAGEKRTKTYKTPSFVKDSEKNSNIFNFFVNQTEFSTQIVKINLNDF